MEATAVSVSKAVVAGALGYAKSFIAEEVALQLGVEGDVSFIGDELEMMQSFLMTADEDGDKHKVKMTWVKQVREVAYNVEDSLMDFSVHSDKRPPCWWCIPGTLRERRGIAKEVKVLRLKVEDVSNRNLRYRLMKGVGSKPSTIAEEQANAASETMFGINEDRRTAIELNNTEVDMRQLITNEYRDLTVIAVWGASSALGLTSAVQDVYNDSKVTSNFGFRAWVSLVHPFNPKELIRSLVRQYYENFPEELGGIHKRKTTGISVFMKMENMSQSDILDLFDTKVSENSYLIVIDDLSTIEEWACIKNFFPDNTKGSRIIVSTQHAEIASLCTEKPNQVSEMKQCSSNQRIYIFHKKVMPSSDSNNAPISNSSTIPVNDNKATPNTEILDKEDQPFSGEEDLSFSDEELPFSDEDGDKVFDSEPRKKFDRSRTMAVVDDVPLGRAIEESVVIELVGQPDDDQDLKVISVWGMGGLGKTTLIQSVYRSPQLATWKQAWSTALRPFNPEQVLRRLASNLLGEDTQREKMELKELTIKLSMLLKNENCLIVLDDISSTREWDLITSFLEGARRIIVTTREKNIAKHCSKEERYMYKLHGLKDDIALDLFKKKVFKGDAERSELSYSMMEQARRILRKCDGLPLAISTIGGLLSTKPKTAIEWKKTNDYISTELEINPELRTIKAVLVRSYEGLPYHLKSCFLYLSIFPEDYKIRRKRVVRRWVAEGYSREMHGMSAEEVGDRYFDELLDRSMILPGKEVNMYSGKINSCHVHDIMRQICISKAREENLVLTLEEGSNLSSTQGAIRHLAISSNWRRNKDVFDRILDLSHVRSLTVFGKWRSFFISKKMRFLRVLDLEDTYELTKYDLNRIGQLMHLKYLCLRRLNGITKLPNSLGNLKQLQTFDVKDTGLYELPAYIVNFRKLKFLHASDFVSIPRGIGELNALCTLTYPLVREKGIANEFTQLYQLRKLGIGNISESNSKEFWSAIPSMNQLQSLSINWKTVVACDRVDGPLDGSFLLPGSIESLKVRGRLSRLTEWIHHLPMLSRLHLSATQLHQDDISAIGKLPHIAFLFIGNRGFLWKDLLFERGSFPSLILLEIEFLSVSVIKFEDGGTPKLELLRIMNDTEVEVSGLRYLTKIKEIKGCITKELEDNNVQQQLEKLSNRRYIQLNSHVRWSSPPPEASGRWSPPPPPPPPQVSRGRWSPPLPPPPQASSMQWEDYFGQ